MLSVVMCGASVIQRSFADSSDLIIVSSNQS